MSKLNFLDRVNAAIVPTLPLGYFLLGISILAALFGWILDVTT